MDSVLSKLAETNVWMRDVQIWEGYRKHTKGSGAPESLEVVTRTRTDLKSEFFLQETEDEFPQSYDCNNNPKLGVRSFTEDDGKEGYKKLKELCGLMCAKFQSEKSHFNSGVHFNLIQSGRIDKLYGDLKEQMNKLEYSDVLEVIAVSIFRPGVFEKDHVLFGLDNHFSLHWDRVLGSTQIMISLALFEAIITFFKGKNEKKGSYTHPAGLSFSVQSGLNGSSKQPYDNPDGLKHSSTCKDRSRLCIRIRYLGYLNLKLVTLDFLFKLVELIYYSDVKPGEVDDR